MKKQWRSTGTNHPNTRLMVKLPWHPGTNLVYFDRKFNTFWMEETCNGPSTWYFWRMPDRRPRP